MRLIMTSFMGSLIQMSFGLKKKKTTEYKYEYYSDGKYWPNTNTNIIRFENINRIWIRISFAHLCSQICAEYSNMRMMRIGRCILMTNPSLEWPFRCIDNHRPTPLLFSTFTDVSRRYVDQSIIKRFLLLYTRLVWGDLRGLQSCGKWPKQRWILAGYQRSGGYCDRTSVRQLNTKVALLVNQSEITRKHEAFRWDLDERLHLDKSMKPFDLSLKSLRKQS